MTSTEFLGLLVLGGWLGMLAAWLQFRRAAPAERRKKRSEFRNCLIMSVLFIVPIGLNFIVPTSLLPPSWEVKVVLISVSLAFLLSLGIAMYALRIALRARNADDQRSPADSDT